MLIVPKHSYELIGRGGVISLRPSQIPMMLTVMTNKYPTNLKQQLRLRKWIRCDKSVNVSVRFHCSIFLFVVENL